MAEGFFIDQRYLEKKMQPLLVLRVGYMERYSGPAPIFGGGSYIEDNGVGGEVFNFKPNRGECYGYAMSRHFAGINLSFLDNSRNWETGDELPGVDVVFIAKKPGVGQVIVGWYRNATVYHKQYRVRRGGILGMKNEKRSYICLADVRDTHLLEADDRLFSVPYAPAGFKGFPGQSNVWYPGSNSEIHEVRDFIRKLRRYLDSVMPSVPTAADEDPSGDGGKRGGRRTRAPDHAHNAEVELAAVEAVTKRYRAAGYVVRSVESENLGWDLYASKGQDTLRVEVKGVSGTNVYFELTPNEYAKLKQHSEIYRVCVVCSALSNPNVHEFSAELYENRWRLKSSSSEVIVSLFERIAAIGVEVRS
jgi:hypothetical protein